MLVLVADAAAVSAVAEGFANADDVSWPPVKPIEGTPVAVLDDVTVVKVVAPFSVVIVDTMVEDGARAVVVPVVAGLEAKPNQCQQEILRCAVSMSSNLPMRLPSISKTE